MVWVSVKYWNDCSLEAVPPNTKNLQFDPRGPPPPVAAEVTRRTTHSNKPQKAELLAPALLRLIFI
jgi:hypothetical protein